jgi:signal transduction histidine kinase
MMTAAQLLLMRQEGQGDPNAKPVSRILTSGQRMARMIEQLLDLTRARSGGGIELRGSEATLDDVCSQAVEELEVAHPDWRIRQEVVGDVAGNWDTDRLLQVISNLVANAGQHGRRGSEIVLGVDGRDASTVYIRVHNQGTIPSTLLPSLFDPFRGTYPRREQSRGLGLGLFIVKEIVRSHGGSVSVESSEAHGTTFSVRLPRRLVPA